MDVTIFWRGLTEAWVSIVESKQREGALQKGDTVVRRGYRRWGVSSWSWSREVRCEAG